MSERIQKVLARQGYGSRRELEQWITSGRIKVNKQVATLGDRISHLDSLTIDGKSVQVKNPIKQPTQILLYHKPSGEICARKDDKFRTVYESLPPCEAGRWVMVGRLDVSTSGLLLFTNNGELAHTLMHPSSEIPRKYLVRVHGMITPEKLNRLKSGVRLSDGPAKFDLIKLNCKQGTNQWLQVVLKEGRNREVKRLFESQDCTVTRLMRIGFGKIDLPKNLPPAKWLYLDANLKKQVFSDLK